MIGMKSWGLGIAAATVTVALLAAPVLAQTTPPAAPAVKAPAATPAPPGKAPATAPAAKAPTTAPAPAKTEKKAAAPSPCKGLDETACKGNAECGWVVPTKVNKATGKADNPYCRKVAGVAKKAVDAKAAKGSAAGVAPAAKGSAPAAGAAPAAKGSAPAAGATPAAGAAPPAKKN